MKVVVTGGGGFVGQWLARALLRRGDEVWLAGLGDAPRAPAILGPDEWRDVRWLDCNMRDPDASSRMLVESRPEVVFHLAGISVVPAAERDPHAAYATNVMGAVHLATAAARLRAAGEIDPMIVAAGSGTQYGRHPGSAMPLTEAAEQRPVNVYAATKAAQEIAVLQIARASGLRVVCTRSFNHSGAGQEPPLLLPSLAKQVRALRETSNPVRIGNDAVRDYLHVEDVVDAYIALARHGTSCEVYNVCSGVGIGVRRLAEEMLGRAGVNAEVVMDVHLSRPTDIPVLVGSPTKLKGVAGWAPRKTHVNIIDDLLAAS